MRPADRSARQRLSRQQTPIFAACLKRRLATIRKPDQQYEHAEYHFPNIPKIEFNARRARPGWQAWGYEAPLPPRDPDVEPAIKPTPIHVDDYPEIPNCLKRGANNTPPVNLLEQGSAG